MQPLITSIDALIDNHDHAWNKHSLWSSIQLMDQYSEQPWEESAQNLTKKWSERDYWDNRDATKCFEGREALKDK